MGSLTETQTSLIIGSLLGDGAMRCKANALLEINHSFNQRTYVDWKYHILADLVGSPPKPRRGNGRRIAYRFTTLSSPQLTPYYRAFYRDGRKVVPYVSLTPLSLAVWFMDDGCKSYNALYLNTQQFALPDQRSLIQLLRRHFGIESTLNRDKTYHRIRIAVSSVPRFRRIVDPHLREEFTYKFPS